MFNLISVFGTILPFFFLITVICVLFRFTYVKDTKALCFLRKMWNAWPDIKLKEPFEGS